MTDKVVVLNADKAECSELCHILEKAGYSTTPGYRLDALDGLLSSDKYLAVILDIDSIPVDNRTIRELTLKYNDVCFFCTSWERFHPELKDAICYHIFACLNKPIDPDELFYWLKCVKDGESDTRDPPKDR